MFKFVSLSFAKDLKLGLQQIGKFAVQLGETRMRDQQQPQHMTARQKFLAMYVAHRSWMEKIRRRIERREPIPQDIDGTARQELFSYGILASGKEKGNAVLVIASAEIMEMFKDARQIEEAKNQAPPSGRKMKDIDNGDDVTAVIPNAKLRGLLRSSTPPPPPRSTRNNNPPTDEAVIDGG